MSISLIPDIPEEERKLFERFYTMFSKLLAVDNLNRGQITYHKARFKRITELLEKGLYDEAREEMAECIMKLQAKIAVDGFDNIRYERK